MKVSNVTIFPVVLFAALSASAEYAYESNIHIAIDDGTRSGQVFIDADNDTAPLDLSDMQIDESRSIVDDNGRTVHVTRTLHGIDLRIEGREIELPEPVDAAVVRSRAVAIDTGAASIPEACVAVGDGVITISSGRALDDRTKENLRSALSSSGFEGQVLFTDVTGSDDVQATAIAAVAANGGAAHR